MYPAEVQESLVVTCDGQALNPQEVVLGDGSRVHVTHAPAGRLIAQYSASVRGDADPVAVTDADRITYLRPSRYAESDRLVPIAEAEFAGISGAQTLLASVSSWVGAHVNHHVLAVLVGVDVMEGEPRLGLKRKDLS